MNVCLLAVITSVVGLFTAALTPAFGQIGSQGGPIQVQADRTEYFDKQGLVRWIGNVEIEQDDSSLYAEQVDIFFNTATNGGARSITRIEARGGVAYIRPNETAQANEGIYLADTGKIRLVGAVSLKRERDTVTGESLLYDPVNGRVEVDAQGSTDTGDRTESPGRVRAIFDASPGPQTENSD